MCKTEPSDLIRQETIKELGEWLQQMIDHGVPNYSAKRETLANAIALLSMDTHGIHTETHECVKNTHDSDLISRADAIKAVEQEYRLDRGYMVDDYTYGFNQAIQYVSDIIFDTVIVSMQYPITDISRTIKLRFPICFRRSPCHTTSPLYPLIQPRSVLQT